MRLPGVDERVLWFLRADEISYHLVILRSSVSFARASKSCLISKLKPRIQFRIRLKFQIRESVEIWQAENV